MQESSLPLESQDAIEDISHTTFKPQSHPLSTPLQPIITTSTTTTTTETKPVKSKHFQKQIHSQRVSTEYPLKNLPTPTALKISELEDIDEGFSSRNPKLIRTFSTQPPLSQKKQKRSLDNPEGTHVIFENASPIQSKRTRPTQSSVAEVTPQISSNVLQCNKRTIDNTSTIREDSASLPSPCRSPSLPENTLDLADSHHYSETDPEGSGSPSRRVPSFPNLPGLLSRFDSLSTEIQQAMVFQMLKRSNTRTLQFIASTILPNLKVDFLGKLPYELGLKVVSYLDAQSACRSARVSKRWRKVVDSDAKIWKGLFDSAGFKLIEEDLVVFDVIEKKPKYIDKLSKSSIKVLERNKKQPLQVCEGESTKGDLNEEMKMNIPGLTVPLDPRDSLEVVAKHPYKYLYRRHHIIRRNWMRGRCSSISFEGHSECVVTCLQFDSDKIVSGTEDFDIHIYDTKTGSLRKKLQAHNGGVWALQYYGNTLVTGSTDRTVRVWDIQRGVNSHTFRGHSSTVRCLQILIPTNVNVDPEGEPIMEPPYPLIVTGSRDSTLRVWRLPSSDDPRYPPESSQSSETQTIPNPFYLRSLIGHAHSVRAIAAYGNTVVSGSYDCTVRVWNVMTGECKWRLEGHTQKVYSVVIDKDRNRCISGSMDCSVRIWSLEHGTCIYALEGHSSLVGLLSLTPNHLVSAAADATLRVWDPDSGTCRNVLSTHTGAITCFQHDDQKVISGSETNLKMWDIKTGKFVRDLLVGLQHVWQVQFDDRRCVAAVQRRNATWFEVFDFGTEVDIPLKMSQLSSSAI